MRYCVAATPISFGSFEAWKTSANWCALQNGDGVRQEPLSLLRQGVNAPRPALLAINLHAQPRFERHQAIAHALLGDMQNRRHPRSVPCRASSTKTAA
jgi:hypothetical protein